MGVNYFIRLLWRQFVPLLVVPILCLVLGFGYLVFATPIYSSSALLNVDVDGAQSEALSAALVSHMEAIRSNSVTSEVIDRLDLAAGAVVQLGTLDRVVGGIRERLNLDTPQELSEEEMRVAIENSVASALAVSRVGDSTLIAVTYFAGSPSDAETIANAYADVYIEDLHRRSVDTTKRRSEFLLNRIEEVRREAVASYEETQRIRARGGLELNDFQDPDARAAVLRETLAEIDEQRTSIETRLSLLDRADDLEALEAAAFQAEGGPELYYAYKDAAENLEDLKARGVAPNYVAQLQSAVDETRRDLDQLLDQTRRGLELDLAVLAARYERITDEFDSDTLQSNLRNWSEILIAEHQAGVFQNIYADHLRDLEVVYAREGVVPVRVMSRARPDIVPVAPDYKFVLVMATVIGFALGGGIALLREWRSSHGVPVPDRARSSAVS